MSGEKDVSYVGSDDLDKLLELMKNEFDSKLDVENPTSNGEFNHTGSLKVNGKDISNATKTEPSSTNGKIKIDGSDIFVYQHPGDGTNPHGTTKSDVGLGNVGNFKAVSTVASQGLSDTERANARANIGAGTSSLILGTTSTTAAAGDHTHGYYIKPSTGIPKIDLASAVQTSLGKADTALQSHQDISGKQDKLTAGNNITISDNTISATDTVKPGTYYCTCATAAATAAKVVTCSDPSFNLTVGTIICITFTYSNTASMVTLNVNDTGAKDLRVNNAKYAGNSTNYCGYASRQSMYMYDGTGWAYCGKSWDNDADTFPSVYCGSSASNAVKGGNCSYYVATAKSYVHVLFRYANAVKSALTLNINSTGAKPIYINGAASSDTNYTLPAGTYIAYYDGTNYYFRTDGKLPASISGDAATVNGKTVGVDVPANAKFTDTTYSDATTTAAGLMSSSDKVKLDGIAPSANNYILPTASASTLGGIKVGTNLSISDGVLSATDTTYSSKTAASGGTDVSLVTTGEKYTWNSKTSNTGTVTSVSIKMNGTSKGTVTSSGTIDLGTVLTSHQDISGKQDKLTAGSNITISGNTISATDTTYSSKTAASGGTNVSLVTTGEKYTWNNKIGVNATTTNCNNCKTAGFYMGQNMINGPSQFSGTWLTLLVIPMGGNITGNYCSQIAFAPGTTLKYMRYCNNNSWSSWTAI